MIKIDVPRSPLSQQRLELDSDGTEFILKMKWISRYQRFYMSIFDSSDNPLLQTYKLVPGAPINLGSLTDSGPQGVFVLAGQGDLTRDMFESGAYILYYIDRNGKQKFPLIREFLVENDVFEFIINFTANIATPDPEAFLFLDGDTFEFLDGDDFEFIT